MIVENNTDTDGLVKCSANLQAHARDIKPWILRESFKFLREYLVDAGPLYFATIAFYICLE